MRGFIVSVWLILILFLGSGWVMNLATILNTPLEEPLTVALVVRVVGIFMIPLGGIVGWL